MNRIGFWAALLVILLFPKASAIADEAGADRAVALDYLGRGTAAFRAGVEDVLLTGLGLAVREWLSRRGETLTDALLVDLEGHGRYEDVLAPRLDLSRTVGWFTTMYPVRLDVEAELGLERREDVLPDRVPGAGVIEADIFV